MNSEFSKRELTLQFNNWDDYDYANFVEALFDFIKKEENGISIRKITDCLYELDSDRS